MSELMRTRLTGRFIYIRIIIRITVGAFVMKLSDIFEKSYKRAPEGIAFSPYRVCPIGAHIDHQLGKVTGLALDKGISIAYGPKQNGVVELHSLNFDKRAQWHIASVPTPKQNDWADHLRGATIALSRRYPLHKGLCGVIEGSLPIGGLSSSAAVIIAFLKALCRVNGITLTDHELVMTAKEAENEYVGVSCGKLDQSCEVYSKKDHLLYLDTLTDEYELIPTHADMPEYEIAVFFSGIQRSLAGTGYNMRVDECKSAAYALMAYSGMDYGKYSEAYLRNIPKSVYEEYRDRLPENWAKRAAHCFGEFERVELGAEAWRRGDLHEYGRLSFESGKSSIVNYETGSPELITLYELMRATDGIYGGRFSGAGFKGCCIALIDPAYREEITRRITEGYVKEYPGLKDSFSVHFCKSADGVKI